MPVVDSAVAFEFLPAFGAQGPDQTGSIPVVRGAEGVSAANLERARAAVERGWQRLKPWFAARPLVRAEVILHRSQATLPARGASGVISEAPGFAILDRDPQEIHIVLDAVRVLVPPDGLQQVVDHELVHVLLDGFTSLRPGAHVPLWLHEGLAQTLASVTLFGAPEEDLVFRVRTKRLTSWSKLERRFPEEEDARRLAYGQSHSFIGFLDRELGRTKLFEILAAIDRETTFESALLAATRSSRVDWHLLWENYLLHGSGAAWRALLPHCFTYLMIFSVPLLALALGRRLRRDRLVGHKLDSDELAEPPIFGPPWPPPERESP